MLYYLQKGKNNMTSFVLKIIAVFSMIFDHLGYIIFGKFSFMNCIGRLSFPIFAFSITEGFSHTKNFKKYLCRLLIFAIISQVPYMLFMSTFSTRFSLNILFTLLLGLITISVYNKINKKILGMFFVISCALIAHFLHFDYGWFGILTIFIFYKFKHNKLLASLLFILITFINYFYSYITYLKIEYIFIMLFCILSLIPINLYNGKKGKNLKYFLYIFYPLHLIVLYLLSFIF